MSRVAKGPNIPLTFNGYNARLILKIAERAQKELWKSDSSESFPIPFINKNDVGCYANFKCKKI